jgi:hypothetical protein
LVPLLIGVLLRLPEPEALWKLWTAFRLFPEVLVRVIELQVLFQLPRQGDAARQSLYPLSATSQAAIPIV